MNDKKICSNCGRENDGSNNFCVGCGLNLNQNVVNNDQQNINNQPIIKSEQEKIDDHNAKVLGIVSLLLYFVGETIVGFIISVLPVSLRNFFVEFVSLCPIAGIVTMVIGRVKYPNNKFLKIVMWIIIVSVILSIILFILLMVWCYITCANMDTSSCG